MANDIRQTLMEKLLQLSVEYPEFRFGQMICNLAQAVRGPEVSAMWDVEDDELITVAERWLENRRQRKEAEQELQQTLRNFEAERG